MKILPLGSECYLNAGLDNSVLQQFKIYKSPFNGTRILTNKYKLSLDIFLTNPNKFLQQYCNKDNWKFIIDHNDLQACNDILNLRRCHLNKDNKYQFIDNVYKSFIKNNIFQLLISKSQQLYLFLDLNDYIIFDKEILIQLKQILDKFNYIAFLRETSLISSIQSMMSITNLDNFNINNNLSNIKAIFNPKIILKTNIDDIECYRTYYNTQLYNAINEKNY